MSETRDGLGFKIVTRVVLPIVILLVAAGAARALFFLKSSAAREKPPPRTALVEVRRVEPTTTTARVQATGIVEPALEVTVVPEVTGKVRWMSKSLVPGGRFKKGEPVLRLSGGEYRLLVKQEKSRVDKAELDLKIERGRQRIAQREWDLIGKGADAEEKELGLRKPHLASAESAVSGARAGLGRARINLGRTSIRAPFNATVTEESVDVGQVVGPSSRLVTLVGTDRFWVRVSVPVEALADLDVPKQAGAKGSKATVTHDLGAGRTIEREGHLMRLVSRLDARTRTAQLLIAVDDPMDVTDGGLPLLPGAYVSVELEGKTISGVFAIPRVAVRDGDRVWVVGGDNGLVRRTVSVRWAGKSELFVTGLEPGDRVVTSPIALPIEGMKVSVRDGAKPPKPPASAE